MNELALKITSGIRAMKEERKLADKRITRLENIVNDVLEEMRQMAEKMSKMDEDHSGIMKKMDVLERSVSEKTGAVTKKNKLIRETINKLGKGLGEKEKQKKELKTKVDRLKKVMVKENEVKKRMEDRIEKEEKETEVMTKRVRKLRKGIAEKEKEVEKKMKPEIDKAKKQKEREAEKVLKDILKELEK